MAASPRSGISIVDPAEAWDAITAEGALIIDVRTRAEWAFVGLPDLPDPDRLAVIEWLSFPEMGPNAHFLPALERAVEDAGATRLYFLCRSGQRSHNAAVAAQAHFDETGRAATCFNIIEGFEGDLDADGRRGRVNGWKARGLPWRQT